MRKLKLFCLPYAGGSASAYCRWKKYLIDEIELCTIDLAGKGSRLNESLYQDFPEAIEDVYKIIRKNIMDGPYALFGHSMGGLISYELAQKIREDHLPEPAHIFFSGKGAPHIHRRDEKKYHLMSNEEFEKEIILLGGTPPEFFLNRELSSVFLPVLKSDFKLIETAIRREEIYPFHSDITVFLGKDDDQTPEQCDGWKLHTKNRCTIHYLEGNHFFLLDKAEEIVGIINRTIRDAYNG